MKGAVILEFNLEIEADVEWETDFTDLIEKALSELKVEDLELTAGYATSEDGEIDRRWDY